MKTANKKLIRFSLTMALAGWALLAGVAGAQGAGFSLGGTDGKNGTCLDCHGKPAEVGEKNVIDPVKYGQTNHARIGCPACHDTAANGHPVPGQPSAKADCTACHDDITTEYTASSHAEKVGCNGCHDPHRVNTTSEISGTEINRVCSGCHGTYQITASHAKWLPQADLHIEMLPCVTCHTGSKDYVINMYIIKRQGNSRFGKFDLASHDQLQRLAGSGAIVSLIDVNNDNYVSLDELRNFNRNPAYNGMHLRSMMMPEKVTHTFQFLDNRRDCTFCHASGPGTMQTSFIAIPQEDGTFSNVAVEKGAVLDALYGTPDFYMTGKTRNDGMNIIGLAIIAGGMVMPIGHGFLRFLTRRIRNKKENGHE